MPEQYGNFKCAAIRENQWSYTYLCFGQGICLVYSVLNIREQSIMSRHQFHFQYLQQDTTSRNNHFGQVKELFWFLDKLHWEHVLNCSNKYCIFFKWTEQCSICCFCLFTTIAFWRRMKLLPLWKYISASWFIVHVNLSCDKQQFSL